MQNDSDVMIQVLSSQWPAIPFLLIYGIGALMAIINWGKHPRVSACALGAFLLWGVNTIGSTLVIVFTLLESSGDGSDREAIMMIREIARMTFVALSITSYVLIICAVFGWRREPSGGMQ